MEPSLVYQTAYLDRGIVRSDVDDNKSLSNDETPPPTCPRQPPDGVETPSDAVEKGAVSPTPPLPKSAPGLQMPPRLPPAWPSSRTRTSYSRREDARSECSVKDKIAMFSTDSPDRCAPLFPTKPALPVRIDSNDSFNEIHTLDRRLTKSQDNLDEVPRLERFYRTVDRRPEAVGGHNESRNNTNPTARPATSKFNDFGALPVHYGSTTNLANSKPSQYCHTRSSSEDSNGSHKSNLEYLIEQRKKSMSKLRGLMIPEVQTPIVDLPEIKVQECNAAKILLFGHRDNKTYKNTSTKNGPTKTSINLADSWKMNVLPNNIPKYSPAFKRKSLQVYSTASPISKESTPERKLESPLGARFSYGVDCLKTIPTKPPRTSIDPKKTYDNGTLTLPSRVNLPTALKLAGRTDKNVFEKYKDYGHMEVKVCTATSVVDSDNDSAVSSTQSSYRSSASSPVHNMDSVESDSSHLSPRSSHYISYSLVKAEQPKSRDTTKPVGRYEKRNVCRSTSSDTNASISSSAGSAATSGSQASCSSLESSVADSDKRKVTRTHSIDTINRRNILASAKCRSGRDLNVGSPVVETKFSHESPDRSPSPQRKTSERLTTLTHSVSGLSNKGESRRFRSKVIADTDSDSESELNVRHRKSEFKNTRQKKNVTQSTKPESTRKQLDCSVTDSIVAPDDVPQVISQRIIKEIKKAGLHDLPSDRPKAFDVKSNKIIASEDVVLKKTENGIVNGAPKPEIAIVAPLPKVESVISEHIICDKSTKNTPLKSNIEHLKPSGTYQVCLKKGIAAGVGLILAGGVDCEAKVVTVHKVLAGSVAEREGLQRGARVRSINGIPMEGLTHAETVAVLKEHRSEVIIEIENENENGSKTDGSDNAESVRHSEGGIADGPTCEIDEGLTSVTVEKSGAGAGLGFGLDGGKDSPAGDKPLVIKKLFAGGAAARTGRVLVGAELLRAGDKDMRALTRTQAWAALKELPEGPVLLLLRNPR